MRTAAHRSRSSRADRSAQWRAPLRRAWRAIDSTQRRIEASARVIDASLRVAAARPVETSRRFERVGGWIAEAAGHLQRALRQVEHSTHCIARAPERAETAPALLAGTTMRCLDVAQRLDGVSIRLAGASARLVEQVRSVGVPRPAVVARPSSRTRAPRFSVTIVLRRQQPAVDTAAAAVRRIFRGRAPPSFQSSCSSHRSRD
jgi:hypothetical protein